jgi:hypothetical protein
MKNISPRNDTNAALTAVDSWFDGYPALAPLSGEGGGTVWSYILIRI